MGEIREIWSYNVDSELAYFDQCLNRFNFLSLDTEFPGFLRNTPRDATESQRYNDLRFNVNLTKIIQLGITLSDDNGNICSTWEFNFCDFDSKKDAQSEESIDFLKRNGLNLEKIRRDGVSCRIFVPKLMDILSRHRRIKWVTFHGLYDLAYFLKLLMNKPMPRTVFEFVKVLSTVFGCVFDIKFIAKYYNGLLGGEIGLNRMAKILGMERKGAAHNAGSDSLLTASIFSRMKMISGFQEEVFVGFLYGVSARIKRQIKMVVPCYSRPMIVASVRPPPPIFCGMRVIRPVVVPMIILKNV